MQYIFSLHFYTLLRGIIFSQQFKGTFFHFQNVLTLTVTGNPDAASGLTMGTLEFFGYSSDPTGIEVNGIPLDSSQWSFDAATSILVVTVSAPISEDIIVTLTQRDDFIRTLMLTFLYVAVTTATFTQIVRVMMSETKKVLFLTKIYYILKHVVYQYCLTLCVISLLNYFYSLITFYEALYSVVLSGIYHCKYPLHSDSSN